MLFCPPSALKIRHKNCARRAVHANRSTSECRKEQTKMVSQCERPDAQILPDWATAEASRTQFSVDQTVIARNALERIGLEDSAKALARHASGDWGELNEHNRDANEAALKDGTRLFSVYRNDSGQKFYIITEADRSCAAILLPEDY